MPAKKAATLARGKTLAIPKSNGTLSADEMLGHYRTMLHARYLDEKMLLLLKQGKSFFHIGGSGHEAAQVAIASVLKPAYDWFYPYYRDLAFVLQIGETPEEIMLCFLARAEDPHSGGRQMPSHYGHKKLRIVSQSSPTGTQFLPAVGCALGAKKEGLDEVVYVSAGEGTTSQGDFHEALNWASREKAPVIFCIEDNKYAISVPIWQQTAGSSVYEMCAGYRGLHRYQVDGTDLMQTRYVAEEAVRMARQGKGPSLIVADVVRLLPHSSSDDHRKYRSEDELAADRQRDPITKFGQYLIEQGLATDEELARIRAEAKKKIDDAADYAESRPHPDRKTATWYVYSHQYSSTAENFEPPNDDGRTFAEPVVLVDAINHALHEEMERNEKMLVFGEDVEDTKGGVFTATRGLSKKYGRDRVFNSPLAESSIIGVAVGLAQRGFKPVPEIQFGDYIWTAMMQLRNEVAPMRYRSNNHWSCPMVIRVPVSGYIHGALCHSQNIEGYFAHLPGLRIAYPSNAADAKGLLKAAIRGDDPVLFLEPKGLYRQGFAKSPEPHDEYLLPFGNAAVKQEGKDLTVITWGALVQRCIEAAKQLEPEGVSCEIIDVRTIAPLDNETILNSVAKTNKVLIVHEDVRTAGFGAEIAARIAELAFEQLDGPIRRVAAADAHVPYNWVLEEEILPQPSWILAAIKDLVKY
jgi:2-oxoisovalerate dehydrogenase E1 component